MMRLAGLQRILFPLLLPLSWLYWLVMAVRQLAYRLGVFRVVKVDVPVICVGNILSGGSGKTPLARYLCEIIQQSGRSVAVVSRGYQGSAARRVNLVSDGEAVLLSHEEAGDEPFMLARFLPGVAVVTSRKRAEGAAFAAGHLAADVIVLDDGFQHLGLARDIDLVLFPAASLGRREHLIPAGMLREGEGALARAQAIVVTGATGQDRAISRFAERMKKRFPDKPFFRFGVEADGFVDLSGQVVSEVGKVGVFAFCGLADPEGFRRSIAAQDIDLVGFRAFPDHHPYSASDISSLEQEALAKGASLLLTTEKDLVKIVSAPSSLALRALRIRVVPDPAFAEFVLRRLASNPG